MKIYLLNEWEVVCKSYDIPGVLFKFEDLKVEDSLNLVKSQIEINCIETVE